MPIKTGLFGFDDYIKFGELLDKLEEAGAYLMTYNPKKRVLYAWITYNDWNKAISNWLTENNYSHTIETVGRNSNFIMLTIQL